MVSALTLSSIKASNKFGGEPLISRETGPADGPVFPGVLHVFKIDVIVQSVAKQDVDRVVHRITLS